MSILWEPSPARIASARLTAFTSMLGARAGRTFSDYDALHQFSIVHPSRFWTAVWDFCGLTAVTDHSGRPIANPGAMPGARFFPDARLSVAQNLLRKADETPALIAVDEAGTERTLSWRALGDAVGRASRALRAEGVRPGDRVCGDVANVPEAMIAALATAAIGAVWASCSPDFGPQGVLDRFGQIEPVVLVATARYQYGGKRFDCLDKIAAVAERLPTVRRVVLLDGPPGEAPAPARPARAIGWNEWLQGVAGGPPEVEAVPFNHPLYIMFSSGTTGPPKCIVHGAGGTLLQHLKEHQLHCDIRAGDRVFYFTTCGWMMWNWLVSALASEATVVLYDGAPFFPGPRRLFDLADRLGITFFGTSAKFLDAVRKAGLQPRDTHALGALRTIASTGSPLAPESFDFVYEHVKRDVHLASISGGTDIISCFVLGNPTAPVHRGEIQVRGLGMDVDVFDEHGRPLRSAPGELVCKSPFPSMPVGFWDDREAARYRAAYFDRFPGVWCHGDWAELTETGVVIYGRSDATLKPGGVRIGTAEIYRQVERLPAVVESLAVGQQWHGDERIVLFVRLQDGLTLDDVMRARIVDEIRRNATPRHVPARIVQVTDIPRTKSGKIVELAVRDILHGREPANREALANPEALDQFRDRPELA